MQNIPYQVCTIYKQCTSNKTHTSSAQRSDMSGKEGRKEGNVYLMTHSTHFILWLYGIRHMVKDHSDSERKPAAAIWATLSD